MAKKNNGKFVDLGLGDKITQTNRVINQDGSFNVIREGKNFWAPYHSLVEMSWGTFLLIVLGAYLGINTLFGLLYVLIGLENIIGVDPSGSFLLDIAYATFFSIETFTTVGYGSTSPASFGAHVIASINALVGLMSFALVTGLIFARFAKPKAQILVSKHAIIAPYEKGQSFQFRIVNKRRNKIIDLEAIVVLSWLDEKEAVRRYAPMPLERKKVALFPLNWTIVHAIDEQSPLYQKTSEDLHRMKAEFLVMIKGFDETYAQIVHLNSSFTFNEVIWNVKFKRMYFNVPGKGTVLRLDQINDTESIPINQRFSSKQSAEEDEEGEQSAR